MRLPLSFCVRDTRSRDTGRLRRDRFHWLCHPASQAPAARHAHSRSAPAVVGDDAIVVNPTKSPKAIGGAIGGDGRGYTTPSPRRGRYHNPRHPASSMSRRRRQIPPDGKHKDLSRRRRPVRQPHTYTAKKPGFTTGLFL